MELSWSKIRNILLFFIILLLSFLFSQSVFAWLTFIDANASLRIIISIIVFLTVFFGSWVAVSFIRIFLFQRRGVKGYQLRGKLAFYFLVVALGSILLVGGLMFYYTSLIERNFIETGNRIFEDLTGAYQKFVETQKQEYEKKKRGFIISGGTTEVVFKISGDRILFLKGAKSSFAREILGGKNSIKDYFSAKNARKFYIGKERDVFLFRYRDRIFADRIPKSLRDSFLLLRKNNERYARLNVLKKYVLPISVVSLIVFSVPIFLAVFFISVFLARSITGNIEVIAEGTRLIADGDLEYRVKVRSGDELEDLAENFNTMALRLKRAGQQVKRVERLEAWQEMAKRLAHEIKNPLTPIKLSAERLLFAYEFKIKKFPGILDKTTSTIINETKRLEALVNEFSTFARLPYLKLENKNIIELLCEIVDFFKGAYPNIPIESNCPEDPIFVSIDENQIKQVIINIISNAIEALPEKPNHINVRAGIIEGKLLISVEDMAGGIDSELKDKIFEPYFTTKAKGTGLGLAIAERIVLEHGGNLWFDSKGNGTEFYIELPFLDLPESEQGEI